MENKKHTFKDWLLATRPWSFPASSMPVLVTLAFLQWKGCDVDWWAGAWAFFNIIIFHAAGNTWSDYSDYKKGVDREDAIGGMSIVSGQFKATEIKKLAWILLSFAFVSGIGLMIYTLMLYNSVYILYFGLAGCLLILSYPWLKYHALGDVDIFLTYSLLPILGTSFVAIGAFNLHTMWLALPIGLITVGILHVNNTRDIMQDKRAGIHTLAMLLGKRMSVFLYAVELVVPFLCVGVAIWRNAFPIWSLAVFVALLPALANVRKAFKYPKEGMKALVGVDEKTAQLQLMFSLLLTVSFFIDKIIG